MRTYSTMSEFSHKKPGKVVTKVIYALVVRFLRFILTLMFQISIEFYLAILL